MGILGFVEILKSYREKGKTEVKRDIKRRMKETAFRNIFAGRCEDIAVSKKR